MWQRMIRIEKATCFGMAESIQSHRYLCVLELLSKPLQTVLNRSSHDLDSGAELHTPGHDNLRDRSSTASLNVASRIAEKDWLLIAGEVMS